MATATNVTVTGIGGILLKAAKLHEDYPDSHGARYSVRSLLDMAGLPRYRVTLPPFMGPTPTSVLLTDIRQVDDGRWLADSDSRPFGGLGSVHITASSLPALLREIAFRGAY